MKEAYDTPGMAMAEALAEVGRMPGFGMDDALTADDDVVMGSRAAAASGSSHFNGLWRDKEYAHMIKGTVLVWGDDTVTNLQIDELGGMVSMVFNKNNVQGSLNAARDVLQWSDGDKWTRVTLDGVWDDYGHFHTIVGDKLCWSNGTDNPLTLSGWSGVAMVFNGAHVRGTLDLSGDTILWSDGDFWQRAGMDGHWMAAAEKDRDSMIFVIDGTTLSLPTGKTVSLTRNGRSKASASIDGVQLEASLENHADVLKWSDGKLWSRISEPERGNHNANVSQAVTVTRQIMS